MRRRRTRRTLAAAALAAALASATAAQPAGATARPATPRPRAARPSPGATVADDRLYAALTLDTRELDEALSEGATRGREQPQTSPDATGSSPQDATGAGDPNEQQRQRIAGVAKEMLRSADAVKKDLLGNKVDDDDVALDLMRYATYRVAGSFFSSWSIDKDLTRPSEPKCLIEDSAPEPSLVRQIASDEFILGFVQEGHLLEVAAGIADEICRTFAPQIIRPMIEKTELGAPLTVPEPPPPEPAAPAGKGGKPRPHGGQKKPSRPSASPPAR